MPDLIWEAVGQVAFWLFCLGVPVLFVGSAIGKYLRAQAATMAEPTPEQKDYLPEPTTPIDAAPAYSHQFRVPPYVPGPDQEITGQLPLEDTTPITIATYISNGRGAEPTRRS